MKKASIELKTIQEWMNTSLLYLSSYVREERTDFTEKAKEYIMQAGIALGYVKENLPIKELGNISNREITVAQFALGGVYTQSK